MQPLNLSAFSNIFVFNEYTEIIEKKEVFENSQVLSILKY